MIMHTSFSFNAPEYARHILECKATSFIELAIKSPAIWAELCDPVHRREVASLLGWPREFDSGHYEQAGLTEFVSVALNSGAISADELWFLHPGACDHLRRRGLLDRVLDLLGFLPGNVEYPNDIGFYLARCTEAGVYEIWRDIDRSGFEAAVKLGLVEAISTQAVHMPAEGYSTAGGRVTSTHRLIVGRLLEMAGVAFCCHRIHYGTKPQPRLTPYLVDFAVDDHAIDVIVSRSAGAFREAGLPDRLDRAWRERGKRVVVLDGGVLQNHGLLPFIAHARVELGKVGLVPGNLSIEPRRCLAIETAGKPGGDDGGGRQ